ncbi:MAG: dihydroorotate dehydrogenase [Candidatus ainarchaeum sp.]|nr:dihydroorotate dehydrogenase [Candidatus ainarchaeum sp.]
MVELGAQLAGVELRNPLVLASGVLGVSAGTIERAAESGAGAVTLKSIGPKPRAGHPNPTVLEWGCGLINAVGLSNPGMEAGAREVEEAVRRVKVPVIASVFAGDAEGFAAVAETVAAAKPALLELNLSCPNVMGEHGVPFAYEPGSAAAVVGAVKARVRGIPLVAKLSPNTHLLSGVARAVEGAGADAINMGNTLGPGMIISLEARRPVLANKAGGVSGPAVRPVAVRCVWDVFEAVKIPIIGTGGVSSGRDALEFVMAGAACVGVGSAVAWGGPAVFRRIAGEMRAWMEANGVSSVKELVGAAHG